MLLNIPVVLSPGNSGSQVGTITNIAPWQFTIGASTVDREFPTYATLGNKIHFKGQSLSKALPNNFIHLLALKVLKLQMPLYKTLDQGWKDSRCIPRGWLSKNKAIAKVAKVQPTADNLDVLTKEDLMFALKI
ncbi:hypothetical protein AgCh_001922 [Apium graveolens]